MSQPSPAQPAANSKDRWSEFAAGWPLLLGASLGTGTGIIAIPLPATAIFMRDLEAEFGWSRAAISFGPTVMIGTLALFAPLIGWASERIAPKWITGTALLALAACLAMLSHLGPELVLFYGALAATAALASGTSTVPYSRAISANFEKSRGFALGVSNLGIGITGILLPMFLVPYAASHGWRAGYVALAIVTAVVAPLVWYLMGFGKRAARETGSPEQVPEQAGKTFSEALRDPVLWTLALAFMLIPMSAGFHLHLYAYLADAGVEPQVAGMIAGFGGFVLVVTRVGGGWLIDRFFAPRVAMVILSICAVCLAALGAIGASVAVLAALAYGLAVGLELDLLGFLTARYFGMRAFGRICGLLYTAILIGTALGPALCGAVYDYTASYTAPLYGAAALLVISALLFATMRAYPSEPAA